MITLKLVVTNNDQNNRVKATKTAEQCQENRVVRLEGKNLSHQKEVKFEAKQEREDGQGQVTKLRDYTNKNQYTANGLYLVYFQPIVYAL